MSVLLLVLLHVPHRYFTCYDSIPLAYSGNNVSIFRSLKDLFNLIGYYSTSILALYFLRVIFSWCTCGGGILRVYAGYEYNRFVSGEYASHFECFSDFDYFF